MLDTIFASEVGEIAEDDAMGCMACFAEPEYKKSLLEGFSEGKTGVCDVVLRTAIDNFNQNPMIPLKFSEFYIKVFTNALMKNLEDKNG